MHPCLQIAEIQERIVSHASKQTTARLARVCQALYEPAMDALWSDLGGYAPLIKCMPGEVWEETKFADESPYEGKVYNLVSISDDSFCGAQSC